MAQPVVKITSTSRLIGQYPTQTVREPELTGVGTETTLGFGSFTFGIITGVVIILIILIILFAFRGLFFSDVPVNYPTCTSNEYYNDPALALAGTHLHASDILYVQNDRLFYKRVPITKTCVPGPDQTIGIEYPQYCLFERRADQTGISDTPPEGECNINLGVGKTIGRAPHNTQASYTVKTWQTNVTAGSNCKPVSGAELGIPLARWDPFP